MANTARRMLLENESVYGGMTTSKMDNKPKPSDFKAFLPWACYQMELDVLFEITKSFQAAYLPDDAPRNRLKPKKSIMAASLKSAESASDLNRSQVSGTEYECKVIRISTTYTGDKLVQIKINKTKHLPREVLSIIGIIIQFYPYLNSIYINSGTNKYSMHEICKFLPFSNITEINLDNSWVKEANYDTILDSPSQLQILSLSRCSLNDQVVERIASKLKHPLPCSKTLSVLNLSCNKVTNHGAIFLGKMLRTNRNLSYLNLAGNMITDDGMEAILNSFLNFSLTEEENNMVRKNYLKFTKTKLNLIDFNMKMLSKQQEESKAKQTKKPSGATKKCVISSNSATSLALPHYNVLYEKARKLATLECGEFDDAFVKDTFRIDGKLYSQGNFSLAYLNISHNNVSHLSVKRLLKVLNYQKTTMKSPKGLVSILLEGNPIPENTPELEEIESILRSGLAKVKTIAAYARRKSVITHL